MDLKRFTAAAQTAYDEIPEEYKAGIDGLVIERRADRHPTLRDIYTLGMCDTESYLSDWVGPDTTRSRVILYYGSFRAMAQLDPDFDWEAEIHETVQHEVRHHLEALSGEDALDEVDYAMDESFKRGQGLDFDPWFWQSGMPMGRGVHVVEDQVFLDQEWSGADFDAAEEIRVRWRGSEYRIPRPDELGDLHFVLLRGMADPPPWFELVLVRKRSWWEDARRLFSTSRPRVLQSEAEVSLTDGGGGAPGGS